MSYILFFAYFVFFCWWLTKIKFVKSTGLSGRIIIGLFAIRVAVGLINGWMSLHYYSETDTIYFHKDGIAEYNLLLHSPKEYFLNIFKSNYNHDYTGFFDTTDSYWNDLRSNIISKILSVFNIFSGCNYYINTLFYNFIVFFGSVSLYKIFSHIFFEKKVLLITCLFLLPSLVFFTSVVHRDGLIFIGLGIVCYNMFQILKKKDATALRIIYFSLGLLLIFLLRNFVMITLIPALIAWIAAELKPKLKFGWFVIVYLFFVISFFAMPYINPNWNLPQYVSTRQIDFIELSKVSASSVNINPLFPNFRSFLNNAPQALNHTLMRPYLTEISKWLYIAPAIEIFIYEILFLLFLLFPLNIKKIDPFILFGIFFSLSMFLEIGYTIPIIGAFVRYRSIYFPFIILPLLCYTNWKKIGKALNIKFKAI